MSDQVLIKVVDELYTYGGFTLCSDALFQLETLINHAENHLIPKLCKVADELDEHHFNSAVAKITGGSVGVGGTVAGTCIFVDTCTSLHNAKTCLREQATSVLRYSSAFCISIYLLLLSSQHC